MSSGNLEEMQNSLANGLLGTAPEDGNNETENQEEIPHQNHEEEEEEAHDTASVSRSKNNSQMSRSQKSTSSRVHEPSQSRNSTASSKNPRNSKRGKYDASEVTALSAQIYQGDPIETDDPDLLAAAILDLKDMRFRMECEGKFSEAVHCVRSVDRAKEYQLSLMKKIYSKEEVENVNEKIEATRKQLAKLDERAANRTSELEMELDELVENLKKRQEQEILRHDEEWKSETKIRDYNRTSGKVRALRYQQQKMLNSKRYDEAEQVKRIADNVVAAEAKVAYTQMKNEYQASYDLLMKKHQAEINTLLVANTRKRQELKARIEKLRRPYLLRISQLENEEELAKKEDRVWTLRYKSESATISRRMGMGSDANVQSARLRIPNYNTMPLPPLETESLKRNRTTRKSTKM